ncbi:MAG: T9SS type A sorting domain-containing protein [Bacteroidia bacterium]|nr:T9SS type A sorting domain-containing protein [Bacteroidia bacterium]
MKKILILCFGLAYFSAFTQITFDKTFGNCFGYSIIQIEDGGYIISGTKRITSTNSDLCIFRLNMYGDTLWAKTYGDSLGEWANEIQKTNDGNYILAGRKNYWFDTGSLLTTGDVWILKINENGDTLWTKTYGGPYNDNAFSIKQTTDGGYIVCGVKDNFQINWQGAMWVLKLDQNGDTTWTKTIKLNSFTTLEQARAIVQTYDGGYAFCGNSSCVIKMNANGDTLWSHILGGSYGYSIIQTLDSGYAVSGNASNFGLIFKLDSLGNSQWIDTLNHINPNKIILSTDNCLIASGFHWISSDINTYDTWLMKINIYGDTLWSKQFGVAGRDESNSLGQTSDNGFIIIGRRPEGMRVLKVNENGDLLLSGDLNYSDCPPLLYNYPNPFSESTTIYFSKNETADIETSANFDVYNSMGLKILSIKISLSSLENGYLFNAHNLPPDIYFYKINHNNKILTNKMIKL